MDFETRIDPNVTDLKNHDPITPTDIYSFHNGQGEGGEGVTVAINDSGIGEHPILDHFDVTVERPDIEGLPTTGGDDVGHGTGVTGMVLLNLPNVDTLVDVPIFDGSGQTGPGRIEATYDYLVSHSDEIDLVNMSWGSARKSQRIDRLHNELEQSGVHAIVASGNTDRRTGSPATAARAFSVAAVTDEGRMTRFSSPTDDVAALGRNLAVPKAPGTQLGRDLPDDQRDEVIEAIGGDWVVTSGTSFSCPIVLGYAGSLYTASPETFAPAEPDVTARFEKAFSATAHDVTGTGEDGEGYVDFEAARNWTAGGPADADAVAATVQSRDGGDRIDLAADVLADGDYDVDVATLREALTTSQPTE